MDHQETNAAHASEAPQLGYTDDLQQAAQQGLKLNPTGRLRVRINGNRVFIDDPVPTARQLLEAGELTPAEDYVLFFVLADGDLESLRLDETVDLRRRGVERFLAFRSDRIFLLQIDGDRQEWGAETITGRALLRLAGRSPKHFGVWRERVGADDERIGLTDHADLTEKGLERFRTAYVLCIEGRELPWEHPTITTEQIAELGGWNVSEGVVEVDPDQNERTLQPGEEIELKRGHRFGKKFCWKRGLVSNPRVNDELEHLQRHFDGVECIEDNGSYWLRVPGLVLESYCAPADIPIVFSLTKGFPGAPPYGFFVPANTTRHGKPVADQAPPAQPPFVGDWRFVSHQPVSWRPAASVTNGDNLWGWVRSIRDCIGHGP